MTIANSHSINSDKYLLRNADTKAKGLGFALAGNFICYGWLMKQASNG
jgi:hypothetical protein